MNQDLSGTGNFSTHWVRASSMTSSQAVQTGFCAGMGTLGADLVGGIGAGGAQLPGGVNFVVSSGGTVFRVPTGASGPVAVVSPTSGNIIGAGFTGGTNPTNVPVLMRIMNANRLYPGGYVQYTNSSNQGVNFYTGRTVPLNESHIPLN